MFQGFLWATVCVFSLVSCSFQDKHPDTSHYTNAEKLAHAEAEYRPWNFTGLSAHLEDIIANMSTLVTSKAASTARPITDDGMPEVIDQCDVIKHICTLGEFRTLQNRYLLVFVVEMYYRM